MSEKLDAYETRLNLFRYREAREELEKGLPEYIEKVAEFQYNNQQWRIAEHYTLKDKYGTCGVCGNKRIVEIFTVENVKTKERLPVGNICINSITNTRIADWYKDVKAKLGQLEQNRIDIDRIERLLDLIDVEKSPIFVSEIGIERLKKMLDRLCRGWKPAETQTKLWRYYHKKWYEAVKNEIKEG